MRFESPEHWLEIFRQWFGPMNTAFARLDAAGQATLASDLLELVRQNDRSGGRALVIPSEYLEVVVRRR
ncbi:MAG: SAM-dependent methyltransferase, partial [Planctomycetota bacterium]